MGSEDFQVLWIAVSTAPGLIGFFILAAILVFVAGGFAGRAFARVQDLGKRERIENLKVEIASKTSLIDLVRARSLALKDDIDRAGRLVKSLEGQIGGDTSRAEMARSMAALVERLTGIAGANLTSVEILGPDYRLYVGKNADMRQRKDPTFE